MADPRGLRASDQEREQTAQQLREHFAAGRLSEEELDDRVQAAYRAQTHHDLHGLVSDLPRLPATPAQQRAELAARRHALQRRLLQQAGGGVGLFVLCTAIWLASGAHGQFWPVWVALVVLLPLLRNGWRLYGPAPELDRVERDLGAREHARGQARAQRRAHRHDRW
ncbi:MAG: DUF1707 domain-containing protein [Solirubrobacterales bacterium]|nr:DUF1707 domain-containing protein [Solirubrobacterales bacterium]MBV9715399.1 DUF1707 domain-containing protein [Solirubrobacterales bacterium]